MRPRIAPATVELGKEGAPNEPFGGWTRHARRVASSTAIPASSTSVAITVMLPPCSSGTSWPIRARSKRLRRYSIDGCVISKRGALLRGSTNIDATLISPRHRPRTRRKRDPQMHSSRSMVIRAEGRVGVMRAAACAHSAAYWLLLRKLEREVSRTVEHSGLVELSIYEGFSASRRRRSSACSSIHSVELVGSRTVKQLIERS